MFLAATLAYPCVLALLCVGAGLLVDRAAGGWLQGALLLPVGAAALIALSQLSTYFAPLASATPLLMAALAVAGFALGAERVQVLARGWRGRGWPLAVFVLTYLVALAPVLLAGRATFSSFMGLADSAVHMLGADYLMHHGQDYAHLDLHNSYGQFINAYYNTSYPSGSDTLFGGSAFVLGLPLIWAFQPFNAFMLAAAAGPAWLLARRMGLPGGWAALAALSAALAALVYGYELIGSVKEITSLSMLLAIGALVVLHERWLRGAPRAALPFALVAAAGVSALGVGFGAWVLAASAVLLVIAAFDLAGGRQHLRQLLALVGSGGLVALVCAWPTWVDLSGSLRVAGNIASTGNPGNLRAPLRTVQIFGVWLRDGYKQLPAGGERVATYVLIALTIAACLLGALNLLRRRAYPLAGWLGLMLLTWLLLSSSATTWVDAKTLMLTSPAVVLLAWGGLAALRAGAAGRIGPWLAPALALAMAGGVLASDAFQYHASNLAPTARYEEMSSVNRRFAGRGPALFTDFDEYSLYVLRSLDVGGPDFVYPPVALASLAGGYGQPLALDRAAPSALGSYPLIVTRRDPTAAPPPSAYRLLWQGTYYQVWGRTAGAVPALAHLRPAGSRDRQCSMIGDLARRARGEGARLLAALAPDVVSIPLAGTSHPARWGHERRALVLSSPGRLTTTFSVPHAGRWELWLKGQIMPPLELALDGHRLTSIAGQLAGNSLVPDTTAPVSVSLSAGRHRLTITRGGFTLAPGEGGSAVLAAALLTPSGAPARRTLSASPAHWRTLCGRQYQWIELVAPGMSAPSV